MLSPIPLGHEAGPPLMSPGDRLLASPLGLTFPSPGLGRTPGAHVVQEGRLSLEMLGITPDVALAGYVAAGVPPGILAPLNAEASVRLGIAGILKSSSIAQPNPSAGNQQPKLTPPALVTATTEQLNAKDAYAAKLKQSLPEKLATEAANVINTAKATVGLPCVDSTRIEATVSAALAADANALAGSLPSLPTLEPKEQLEKRTTNAQQPQQPQRTSRRVAAKRARDPEVEIDPATLPPPKRVARMEALYDQLRALHDYNITLSASIRQAKGDVDKLNGENENLWAATAHIGAAMHAAIEERDAQAGEISLLPSLGEEEEEEEYEELEHRHPLQQQQQQEQMPPSTGGGPRLVPVIPHTAGRPSLLTPGTAGLAALFSPSGDDLFAACNMFVSPLDRIVGLNSTGAEKQLRSSLFPETAKKAAAVVAAATAGAGEATEARNAEKKDAQPAFSDDKSFSFRL